MSKLDQLRTTLVSKLPPQTPGSVWLNPIHYIACGFGVGCLPIIPGTFATLIGVAVALILSTMDLSTSLCVILLMNATGILLCGKTNRDFNAADHPAACFDEIAAFPICMMGINATITNLIMAFVLFRALDILKPPPINWIDKNVHGGIGVMLDDIIAAMITLLCMHGVSQIFR